MTQAIFGDYLRLRFHIQTSSTALGNTVSRSFSTFNHHTGQKLFDIILSVSFQPYSFGSNTTLSAGFLILSTVTINNANSNSQGRSDH